MKGEEQMKKRHLNWNHIEWFMAQIVFIAFCIPTALKSCVVVLSADEKALYETNPLKWVVLCVAIIWWIIATPCGPIEYIRRETKRQ